MCIILDANCFHKLLDPENQDMLPVRKWLDNKNGKIVFSPTKKMEEEWMKRKMEKQLKTWRSKGKIKLADKTKVDKKSNELQRKIKSNDPHIIALAMVAGVKVLISEDQNLHEDFKNKSLVGGSIYQNKDHEHLLRADLCP